MEKDLKEISQIKQKNVQEAGRRAAIKPNIVKTIYSKVWETEAYLCLDDDGYYLMNVNTEQSKLRLCNPKNYGKKINDIADVIDYEGTICYVFEVETNKYCIFPAVGKYGSPDFIKTQCPKCQHEFYYDGSRIPNKETYDTICEKCGMHLHRKKQ